MGKNSRIKINLIRKRFNFRTDKINKKIVISILSVVTFLFIGIVIAFNINTDKTKIDANIDIYNNESIDTATNIPKKEEINPELSNPIEENTSVKPNSQVTNNIKLTILGEMMMGGAVTKNTSYLYNSAFKKIFTLTRDSDFTYCNFSTNITNLEKIENTKSKYLVTKEVINAINGLGIDAVSIASDHMLDFPKDIFKNTLNLLKDNNTYISGLDDSILYLEKNGKKIAIISSNNVFIGIKRNYTDYGINVYSAKKMKEDITKARQNADFVIVDIHWGRENIFGVTSEMKEIAYLAIDNGANLIIGSHALGIYPIITYKDTPIIYSTGYIMTDSTSELAKTSYIFDININKENRIDSIEMTPTYISDKKEVIPYFEYSKELAYEFNLQMNKWQIENNLNSEIDNDKIIVKFK
ncbi:MAG: CapA family protein [Clostridia bacterium]